jgi:hypothetical protein
LPFGIHEPTNERDAGSLELGLEDIEEITLALDRTEADLACVALAEREMRSVGSYAPTQRIDQLSAGAGVNAQSCRP